MCSTITSYAFSELHRKNQQWIGMPNGVRDDPDEVQISKTSGGCKVSCSDSFWESDMVSQLEKDCVLRESVGRVFQKVTGAAGLHMHHSCSYSLVLN